MWCVSCVKERERGIVAPAFTKLTHTHSLSINYTLTLLYLETECSASVYECPVID